MRNFLLLCFLSTFSFSCKKNNAQAGSTVEMYLLSSSQFVPGKCKLDTASIILESTPFLKNDDIIQYTRTNFQYKLTEPALQKVRKLTGRTPFAITVDKKVIFYGVNMPFYMSSVCLESITLSESFDQNSSIMMSLGYPGFSPTTVVDDQRNNATLIATFIKQGKLR